MAFFYLLQALQLPPGGEIIFPALTFWVVPEMARVAGFTPVFADVDPVTFNIDPAAIERAITPNTCAVVPTHLYGLPCDMDPIMSLAVAARPEGHRGLRACARRAPTRAARSGTFGDGAFFSFQTLKPLNTYGGGLAIARDPAVVSSVRQRAEAEPWPGDQRINNRLKVGAAQRFFSRPLVFTLTAYPALLVAMLWRKRPDVYLWEKVRPLDPMPPEYRERYTNVQAEIGLASLPMLDTWTAETRAHAETMNDLLAGLPGVRIPFVPDGCEHVYSRYCAYTPDRDELVRRALVRGMDLETMHVDVCTTMEMFGDGHAPAPNAARAAHVVQLPVYASLGCSRARAVARAVRRLAPASGSALQSPV